MAKKIDTHAHLGECCVFGLYATEEDMIRRMDESGVDATIVQPYPGAKDYVKKHDEIERLCLAHHGKSSGGGTRSRPTPRFNPARKFKYPVVTIQ
jgi:uncharacterized protein